MLGNVVGVVGTFVVLSGAGPFFVGSLAVAAVATGLFKKLAYGGTVADIDLIIAAFAANSHDLVAR